MQLHKEYDEAPERESFHVMKLAKVVVGWLKDHILVHDMDFAGYYKNRH